VGAVEGRDLLQLLEDVPEGAGFKTTGRLAAVAMHGIAAPQDGVALGAGRLDEGRQHGLGPPRAEARDEGEAAGSALGVQNRQCLPQGLRRHGSPHLQADGIGDAPDVLQVSVVQLPGALANPEEVGPQVVVAVELGHEAGEGRLEGQVQGLVAGEQLAGAEVLRQPAQALDEIQRVPHLVEGFQVVARVLPAPGQVPVLGMLQVREAPIHQGPQVVQGGGGPVVGLQQAGGVGLPLIHPQAVDEVAPVDRHLLPVDQLREPAAGLGVLAGDASQVDDPGAPAVGDEHGHLEQHAQLVLDDGAAAVPEGLGAVAPLQEEALARGGFRQQLLEGVHFLGHHQGRQLAQFRQHGVDGGGIAVDGLLGGG
jgi:hypothetical protein